MNKTILALTALAATAAVSAPASAATTFKIDTTKTSVSVKDNTVCLIGNCSLSASLMTLPSSFNLNPGQSTSFDFAKFVMGSGFGWGTATVNATLSFLTPGGSANATGKDSYIDLGGLFTAGTNSFVWNNPVQTITAGNGANYTVSFTNVADCDSFVTRATVRLNSVGAVPEPATWGMMLLGVGALGIAMRRQRKVTTRVTFA